MARSSGPTLPSSLGSPLARKSTSATNCPGNKFGNPGMRPLPFAARSSELLESPAANFRRAVGQHFFSEKLARIGSGLGGKRLLGGGDFAGNGARGIFPIFHGEKRFAVAAVEQIDKTLLGGLRDGIDTFATALHGEQRGRRRKIAVPEIVLHALKMPDALAGFGVQRDQSVRE